MFSIGQLSQRTGVKVPTIRYYEQTGLLSAAGRTAGNQRRYGQVQLERLGFIKHARDLGFSIQAITALIDLSGHPGKPCAGATELARQQLEAVRAKIARLQRLEVELERMCQGCDGASEQCYVLASLSDHELCDGEH